MAEAAYGQDEPSVAETPPYRSPTQELRDAYVREFPLLDDPDSLVRHKTQKRLQEAIQRALLRKNPIPDQDLLIKYRGSLEQNVRTRRLHDYALYQRAVLPTQLHNETDSSVLVRSLLSSHWHMPIVYHSEERSEAEALLRPHESISALGALQTICHQANCVPHLSVEGIKLEPAKGNESLWTDGKIFWLKEEREGRMPLYRLFAAPDHASIAQLESTSSNGQNESAIVHVESVGEEWETKNNIPKPRRNTPVSGSSVRVSLLKKPIRGTVVLSEHRGLELGPQQLTVRAPEKVGDVWHTIVEGSCFPSLPWTATTTAQDTPLYEVTANNRYYPKDTAGRVLPCNVSGLTFSQREFTLTMRTSEEPASIDIVSYDDVHPVELRIPETSDMERVFPSNKEK